MGRFSLDEPDDYFGPLRIERTCIVCRDVFEMDVEPEYQNHVLCDQCQANDRARQECAAERPLRGAA